MHTKTPVRLRIEKLMRALLLGIVTAMGATTAQAALSGYYDSAEQIQAIVQDVRVADAFKQMPIERLEILPAQSNGTTRQWRIRSMDCELTLELKAQPPGGPGKTTYIVTQVGECR